ncbi:MAG: 16S rRNA (cytosine(1402)-N(4))-methyltransferase RsmH [Bradymonadaceae bacterium]
MSSNSSPYATPYHEPVLVAEVLEYLDVKPGGRYVDGTLGGGGHTRAILDRSAPDGKVLAIDRDPQALDVARARLTDAGDRVRFVQGNYGDAASICKQEGFEDVDGFLVDAGVSSHQLDTAERGFSFSRPGPLDMRMGPDAPTLEEYLTEVSLEELGRVLKVYGELRSWRRLAREILDASHAEKLEDTGDLARLVEGVVGRGAGSGRSTTINPATLVFQALRIAVNRELEHLEAAVEAIPRFVGVGGRAVFISFHSLEDRIVKHGFRTLADPCTCPPGLPVCICGLEPTVEVLTSKPVQATEEELDQNPRARSARLRAVRVLKSDSSPPNAVNEARR